MLVEQRVVLVTGGSRGIGRATCLAFARHRAARAVVVNYASAAAAAAEVVAGVEAAGLEAAAIAADVGDPAQAQRLVQETVTRFGRLDVLVNNAGITRDNVLPRLSDADWDDVLRVDLGGAFYCARAASRPMLKQRFGRIINVSSVAGVVGNRGQANYSAAKAGMVGFTKAVARELGARGITVNAVAPGYIATEMTDRLPDEVKERLRGEIPSGRLGTPEDVAEVIVFLASPAADYINGQTVVVDGGLTTSAP